MSLEKTFVAFAQRTSQAAGRPWTFGLCVLLVVVWAASGPVFKFSETWQLVINTGTTIVTFLMVFLIQNTQNRDAAALQAKLDDLILSSEAENAFIGIEKKTDKELDALLKRCEARAKVHASAHSRVRAEIERRSGTGGAKASAASKPMRSRRALAKGGRGRRREA